MARKGNVADKRRIEVKLNGYQQTRLAMIMKTGLWSTEAEALITGMLDLANRVEQGEFTEEGRTL
jgi:hypothetical protein